MSEQKNTVARAVRVFGSFRYRLVLEGLLVGAAAGLVTVLFRVTLEQADRILRSALAFARSVPWFAACWFVILLAAAALVTFLLSWEPLSSGSGIPQVEGELQGRITSVWWKVLPAKFLGGMLSIGAGLSLGREGPSIQLGAMAGKGLSRCLKRDKTEERLLITCGASAGLAAAFNAPLAGVLFSLEEVHKNFSLEVLLSAMSSSIAADYISRNVFGLKPIFDFSGAARMPLHDYWMVLLLGVVLGIFGVLYNSCVEKFQDLYARIPCFYVRIAVPFVLAGVLGLFYPAVLGGGHGLVAQVTAGMPLFALAFLLGMKFLFSMVSFGSGAPGGIFLPLLVLGAVTGGVFSGSLESLGMGVESQEFIILGMAGMFSAIVRSPVTGIILISEMTGDLSHLLTLSLVSLTAYVMADLFQAKPIYDQLLQRMLKNRREENDFGEEKVLIESPVHHGASACGKRVTELGFPAGSLVISVRRGEEEIVPDGRTFLEAGDTLVILCGEKLSGRVQELLEQECRRVEDPRPE